MSNIIITKEELRAFCIAAFQKKNYGEILNIILTQYSNVFRAWRWKYGINLKRSSKAQSGESKGVVTYLEFSKIEWTGEKEKILENSRNYFNRSIGISSKHKDTYRAAGGKRVPWGETTDDVQDDHAWHRLYWILDSEKEPTIKNLRMWLNEEPDEVYIHPYTVSERIHNLCEFLAQTPLQEDLLEALIKQVYHDANYLEQHFELRLGIHNHVLNNARALGVAACVFIEDVKSLDWIAKITSLWEEYWPKLILEDGFFLEQSSYYHVLMTRTLLEYLACVRLWNLKLSSEFLSLSQKMCAITDLLIREDGSIPIFGDASPDMPIEWLRGLSVDCYNYGLLQQPPRDQSSGYSGGVGHTVDLSSLIKQKLPELKNRGGWRSNTLANSGLLFCRNDDLNLELSAFGILGPDLHGHHDAGQGSYEIWWCNRKIVVDGGVPFYGVSNEALFFKSAYGQNTIMLDGISPTPHTSDINQLPDWYTDKKMHGTWEHTDRQASYVWYGFSRYKNDLIWRRTWNWDGPVILVTDSISGAPKKVSFQSHLHFGDSEWHFRDNGCVESKGCSLIIKSSDSTDTSLTKMSHSPNYGVVEDAQGVVVSGKVSLPFELEWRFEFQDREIKN